MRKPANPIAQDQLYTTVRVGRNTRDQLETIRSAIQEWMLGHPDQNVRRQALDLTADRALRIVFASFARDYRIPNKESQ